MQANSSGLAIVVETLSPSFSSHTAFHSGNLFFLYLFLPGVWPNTGGFKNILKMNELMKRSKDGGERLFCEPALLEYMNVLVSRERARCADSGAEPQQTAPSLIQVYYLTMFLTVITETILQKC